MSTIIRCTADIASGRSALNAAMLDTILRPAERLNYRYDGIRIEEARNAQSGAVELVATATLDASINKDLPLNDQGDDCFIPKKLDGIAKPIWRMLEDRYSKALINGAPADAIAKSIIRRTKIDGISCVEYFSFRDRKNASPVDRKKAAAKSLDFETGLLQGSDGLVVRLSDVLAARLRTIVMDEFEIAVDINARQLNVYGLTGAAEKRFKQALLSALSDEDPVDDINEIALDFQEEQAKRVRRRKKKVN